VLDFRILGPLEVWGPTGRLDVSGQRQRALLAILVLHANHVVSTDALIDALWPHPPRTASTSLQNGISQLRKLLGPDTVETRPPGYALRILPEQLDVLRFERLVREARSKEPEQRVIALRHALDLWYGPPLGDLAYEAFAQDEIRRMDELRLAATEELLDAKVATGGHAEVVADIDALVAQEPLRESLRELQMRALYLSDRQADAVQAFHDTRRLLDDHGLVPGERLRVLHRRILQGDTTLRPLNHSAHAQADHYEDIVRALLASRLVPVLGPQAAGTAEDPPPDAAGAAAHLAQVFGYPANGAAGLARISQYAAVTHGVGPLYDELHALYGREYAPGIVHRTLAAIAVALRDRGLPRQLVVTTAWDRRLETAFAEVGEEFDVLSYVAVGRHRGRFLHIAGDGSARIIDEPNVEVGLTPEKRTVILKVHGGCDPDVGRERESYVVSEDDHIQYLAHTPPAAVLPVGLAARLRRSHFLFLGYGLEEWSRRVFLCRLWGHERVDYRSWAVSVAPDPMTVEYWRQRGVDAFDIPPDEYVVALRQRLDQDGAGEVVA
jgi:DNA-binding SARP family transcriptional activator